MKICNLDLQDSPKRTKGEGSSGTKHQRDDSLETEVMAI